MTKGNSTALAPLSPEAARAAVERAAIYAQTARSTSTQRAYASDWKQFEAWAHSFGALALPAAPALLASYVAHLADDGYAAATIERAVVAISRKHAAAGEASPRGSPIVRETLSGIRRRLGTAQNQKAPLLVTELREAIAKLPPTLHGVRDRALLLIGFFGGFRRSELVAIQVADLEWVDRGLVIHVRRSKTDQEGAGRKVAIPHGRDPSSCAVQALRSWLDAAAIQRGPVFRGFTPRGTLRKKALSDRSVARLVKVVAQSLGRAAEPFAGHSLRAGFVTSAAKAGKPLHKIKAQTGHRSDKMIQRYIRDAGLFEGNAGDL